MSDNVKLIDPKPIKKFIVDGLNNPDPKKAFGYDAISILTEIEFAPVVDPVKHGRWVLEFDTYGAMQCSICKNECPLEKVPSVERPWTYDFLYLVSDYCPHCGAKMDGGVVDATD